MRIVVALGGNALLRRGESVSMERQRARVADACARLAAIASGNDLVVAHGNGPQIGLLALEAAALADGPVVPLDVLGAESQGMIGYLLAQELANVLPRERPVATLLTMVEVDPDDPAFGAPTKPIGPVYDGAQAEAVRAERGWVLRRDGDGWRRVVPSPAPLRSVEQRPIGWLLEHGCVVVCGGGGGVPVTCAPDGRYVGVEAVVDKDAASALLARDLGADRCVMATDVDAVYLGFGTAAARRVVAAHPDALARHAAEFAAGSMGPKVDAACMFARASGHPAVIGALDDLDRLVEGAVGTRIATDVADGLVVAPAD
jgi:carbamate kinase